MFGATYLKAGEVVHNFEGDWILGSFFGPSVEKIDHIESMLKDSFKVVKTNDIVSMKWVKVFVNFKNMHSYRKDWHRTRCKSQI